VSDEFPYNRIELPNPNTIIFSKDIPGHEEMMRKQAEGRVLREPKNCRPIQIIDITPTSVDDLIRKRLAEKKA
jgi:hypothetical protein